ncbi:hypothetical protein [Thermomonas sp.]|uniref:hypothetical protein n=2 Tax=Thermomonas sp. TaxID=1971895 RepID=UPI00262CFA1F|nr:hypothetical protein [Thermomonas sp.]MCO5054420.1 hypothetical protein [Thermomonas sp.]
MRFALLLASLIVIVLALWLAARTRRDSRRRQAIRGLLDAADALEAQLRAARSEIEAIAGDHENPVRQAMQELLRQRLWLQENAGSASLAQLDEVRRTLDAARSRIEAQLQQIERARGVTP